MDRTTLFKIFEKAYNHQDWLEVLKSIFDPRQLYAQPKPILLPNNQLANEAFELGSFVTSDDRIIGLYHINVKSDVWLQRNKVSLRELLRNVYKYDVDGAIVVFAQNEKWRLSFISEIKVLNDEGEIIKQATEPKRYTYLLGKDEKVRTPSDRLSKLANKATSLQDLLNAFSVETLNEEFYKIVQSFFYELVGGKIGKGTKITDYGIGIFELPNEIKENRQLYQEFAVRLIGRTVFCWFLKMKKSNEDKALLPEHLLSSKAVKENNNYYHSILERLFFQTLNTPVEKRIANLPIGAEIIPFLNGGLFEPNNDDFYKLDVQTGLSEYTSSLNIDDDWFSRFFLELEKYNFTIDENSVTEVEVSVDPEMLGRIFENLLAEIDPDSGETARKATGSFYTPREIVDYMATESLVQYIHNKTSFSQERLRPIFKMMDKPDLSFTPVETEKILDALDKIKILDPACGSGAFPMGILQKIVQALQKLDPDADWWKKRQVARVSNAIIRKQLKEKLESSGVEYARKIGVIQNSLYGVDIQPVAAEISKLRCFLSLIVDENIDETKPNRGIEPLPNLEFKFVTADTLINLPEINGQAELNKKGKKSSAELEIELNELRQEYIQSYGDDKKILKQKFKDTQKQLFDQQGLFGELENNRYHKISNWNPFDHDKSDWFDPKWMFGVEKFDVIIGNPPYIKEATNKAAFKGIKGNEYYQGKMDIWYYFACHLLDMLPEDGNLTLIATNNWVTNSGASKLRNKITKDAKIIQLIDFGNTKVFSSAGIQTMILMVEKDFLNEEYKFEYKKINSNSATLLDSFNMLKGIESTRYSIINPTFKRREFINKSFLFNNSEKDNLLDRIKSKQNFELNPKNEIASGIDLLQDFVNKSHKEIIENVEVGDGIFNLNQKEYEALNLSEKEKEIVKPFFTTNELQKYYGKKESKFWIIYTNSSFKDKKKIELYPNIKKHLDKFLNVFTSINKPYGLHRSRDEYYFTGEKIFSLRKCSNGPRFTYTDFDAYVNRAFMVIKTNRIDQKFLTGLFNSSLIAFWLRYRGKMQGFNFQIDKEPLLNIPIFKPKSTEIFAIIVDYIIHTKRLEIEQINPHVPNSHIGQLFEEVIDAMILELYFKEDFERAEIEFINYAIRDFESIESKSKNEQIEIIHRAYQKLREKDNEIRNNLKLMNIKMAEIVVPIKAVLK